VKLKEKNLREGINKCEDIIKQLEINSTVSQNQINEFFNKIRNKLDEKEQELLNKLEEIEKHKKKGLELQKEEFQFRIESIIGSCQMIQNSLSLSNKNKNDIQFMSMKNLYQSRLNYLSTNIWNLESCNSPFIEFLVNKKEEESIYSSISNIGMIDSNEISADKCLISRDEKQIISVDEEFKFEIISYSKDGNQIKNGGNGKKFKIHIEREQKNEKQGDNELEIVDLNHGKYEVIMKLKDEGKYLIFVKFNGINICSSPFQIQVLSKSRNYNEINQPILTFGSQGNGNGQFNSPLRVTTDSKGNIFICDYNNQRIQLFDCKGNFILSFPSPGSHGIAINSKEYLLISGDTQLVKVLDSQRKLLFSFGSEGKGNGQFNYPYGICVDSKDNIYICDYGNHRIQIFDLEGKFISTFGSKGNGNGQFNYPIGICINSKGNIIVCEYDNHRIQIFDSKGKFISTFGSEGNGNGQFNGPYGICVDLNDNIFVCDQSNHRIQIFTSNGEYITQFGVSQPTDIIIDPNTRNIIVCGDDNRVSIF